MEERRENTRREKRRYRKRGEEKRREGIKIIEKNRIDEKRRNKGASYRGERGDKRALPDKTMSDTHEARSMHTI